MKIFAISGILGSTLITLLILMATLLLPWFSWQQNALSGFGVVEVALIFNLTVFIGGLLNLIFFMGLKNACPKTQIIGNAGKLFFIFHSCSNFFNKVEFALRNKLCLTCFFSYQWSFICHPLSLNLILP